MAIFGKIANDVGLKPQKDVAVFRSLLVSLRWSERKLVSRRFW